MKINQFLLKKPDLNQNKSNISNVNKEFSPSENLFSDPTSKTENNKSGNMFNNLFNAGGSNQATSFKNMSDLMSFIDIDSEATVNKDQMIQAKTSKLAGSHQLFNDKAADDNAFSSENNKKINAEQKSNNIFSEGNFNKIGDNNNFFTNNDNVKNMAKDIENPFKNMNNKNANINDKANVQIIKEEQNAKPAEKNTAVTGEEKANKDEVTKIKQMEIDAAKTFTNTLIDDDKSNDAEAELAFNQNMNDIKTLEEALKTT